MKDPIDEVMGEVLKNEYTLDRMEEWAKTLTLPEAIKHLAGCKADIRTSEFRCISAYLKPAMWNALDLHRAIKWAKHSHDITVMVHDLDKRTYNY